MWWGAYSSVRVVCPMTIVAQPAIRRARHKGHTFLADLCSSIFARQVRHTWCTQAQASTASFKGSRQIGHGSPEAFAYTRMRSTASRRRASIGDDAQRTSRFVALAGLTLLPSVSSARPSGEGIDCRKAQSCASLMPQPARSVARRKRAGSCTERARTDSCERSSSKTEPCAAQAAPAPRREIVVGGGASNKRKV